MNKVQEWILENIVLNYLLRRYQPMLDKIREALSGKKTYLVAVSMIIAAVIEYAADGDLGKLINSVLIALGGISLRAGVAK